MGAYENILQHFNWSQKITAGTIIIRKNNYSVNRKATLRNFSSWDARAEIFRELKKTTFCPLY